MLSGERVPSAFCNLSVVCLFWLGVIRGTPYPVYLAHLNRPSHKSSEDLLLFFEGIAFVHLSPSIYTFHDIRRNVADLPSPFLWGKFSILMIRFETKENDDEGYHQLKIDMEK
ncbi:hypothetical protein QL285_024158 [Trifolium repens]|nr:hypothetical protein QL285_082741 [Trifolium repens]KAK2439499.1 hypothetical protein QL285_024158 [Trifolium repens]